MEMVQGLEDQEASKLGSRSLSSLQGGGARSKKMGCSHTMLQAAVTVMAVAMSIAATSATGGWEPAHATFYGYPDPLESQKGACAYDNVFTQGYGEMTTALSTTLFNGGATCGACFELQCQNSTWCLRGSVTVTATNLCPPSDKPSTAGGWCNLPLRHFDLNKPAFLKIGQFKGGYIPVLYRRVPCVKSGGIKFEIKGNKYWFAVLVYNVGGAGDVRAVAVKGTGAGWIPMRRNWGAEWLVQGHTELVGQSLSFQVTASDGRMVQSDGVAPASWQFGMTYQGKQF